MSVYPMTWVLKDSLSTGNDRMVLVVIADNADHDGFSMLGPGINTIAGQARVHRTTVMDAVERLERSGELLVLRPPTHGRGHHNRYAVTMGRDPLVLADTLGWPAPNLDATVVEKWSEEATFSTRPDEPETDFPQPVYNGCLTVDNFTTGIVPNPVENPENGGQVAQSEEEKVAKWSPQKRPYPRPKDQDQKPASDAAAHEPRTDTPDHADASPANPASQIPESEIGHAEPLPEKTAASGGAPNEASAPESHYEANLAAIERSELIGYVFGACRRGLNRPYVERLAEDLVDWALPALGYAAIRQAADDALAHGAALPTWLVPNLQKRAENLGKHLPPVPDKLKPKGTAA